MPNRVLRDWTTSETIDTLSLGAEVFFTRLIMKADDYGNYTANLKLLRSALFPLKNYEDCQVEIWLNECAKAKVILIYCSEGKSYIHIPNFGQRLRAMKSQYPDYVSTNDRQLTVIGRLETKRNEVENESETDWQSWGDLIVDRSDPVWEAMRGRIVSRPEMDNFISVATRNKWVMKTAQDFRTSLKGFTPFGQPQQRTNRGKLQ